MLLILKITFKSKTKNGKLVNAEDVEKTVIIKWCTGGNAGGNCDRDSGDGKKAYFEFTNTNEDMSHIVNTYNTVGKNYEAVGDDAICYTHKSASQYDIGGGHKQKTGYDYMYWELEEVEVQDPKYPDDPTKTITKIQKTGSHTEIYDDRQSGYYNSDDWEEEKIHNHDEDEYCTDSGKAHSISTKKITCLKVKNVNLGLFKREQPDIALTSHIDRVEVRMNNQKYKYKYTPPEIPNYDGENNFGTVKFQNKYTYTYRKEVDPANIGYINDPESGAVENALEMYVTYKVKLENQSNSLGVKVHKIVNDYDLEYTIITDAWEAEDGDTIANYWTQVNSKTAKNDGFKKSVSSKDLNIKLSAGESKVIEVKYKISQDAIKGLISHDSTLSNVFEIHTYSTQYGSNTLYAEESKGGRTGNAYAGRDRDSQPGNAGSYVATRDITVDGKIRKEEVLDVNKGQDDTDIAPSFIIELAKKYRVIEGTVFEDTQTDASEKNKERLGNGVRDKNEVGVQKVRVELWDLEKGKDENGKPVSGIATMYKVDRTKGKAIPIPAVTWTDENGNYSFGNTESFGVVVNNYQIRYVYGNDDIKQNGDGTASSINGYAINARDYKSTIITQDPIKGIMQGKNIDKSEKWHLIIEEKEKEQGKEITMSTAVDDLKVRNKTTDVTPLINGNFNQAFNMEANSVPFELQVEYTIDPWAKVDKNGKGSFNTKCSTFDFGIIERPREDLIIDKTVTKLKLTLANGQVLIDGDPRVESLDYTKAIGVRNPSADARTRNVLDKLISIEMDAEYIQGATLEAWYEVTATNNSEKDYEYSEAEDTNGQGKEYYYFGDKEGLTDENLIDNSIELVVDYLDPELMCTIEEGGEDKEAINTDWAVITADELKDKGYISNETYKKLKAENYLIFGTSIFNSYLPTGTSRSTSLYASKLLANKDDKLEYENHTEIISINGKVARTINSIEDETRNQINKTYIPGDYTLLREYHQQDDDMVKIVITPPTGLEDMIITYISIAAIALSVIGVGVYIIKKKVLK